MPANILNLRSYTVTAVQENDFDYYVDVESRHEPFGCPHCAHTALDGFGRREQMVKDLPMHGKRVGVYIDTRRYRCKACRKTFYETLPDINERRAMTNRLTLWVGKQAIKRTFASIAEEVGIDEKSVRSVFRDYINELEKTVRFETPKWMGIDEIHLVRPRGVIANIHNNTIVELLPNRNKETMIKYLSGLEGHKDVQFCSIDMWTPYKDAIELVMPQAKIVIDKFHVLKMANEAFERVRKSYRESLTPKQRRGLMHDRFVMLKREHDLTDQEALKLSGWLKNYPELGQAYRLKEDFFKIYDAKTPEDALARFSAWDRAVTHEVRDAFFDLIKAWRNWQPYIISYFDRPLAGQPITNAYTECLNGLIRVMDRLGRGYSFEALRAKILFAEGAFKKELIKPKFSKRRPEQDLRMKGYMMEYVSLARALPETSNQHNDEGRELNYGVDISTLTRMIENGEI
ncbi:ISL3 family transposase [Ferrovum myxofaciens]|uniref:ISL3 family transposase n=1 Tax=Ferrovum myxofaciens TaxID=416213 RepID=UPI003EBD5103